MTPTLSGAGEQTTATDVIVWLVFFAMYCVAGRYLVWSRERRMRDGWSRW